MIFGLISGRLNAFMICRDMISIKRLLGPGLLFVVSACGPPSNSWNLMLAHSAEGDVSEGSVDRLISAVRSGCDLRVGWGARRVSDPSRTIEHIAEPVLGVCSQ